MSQPNRYEHEREHARESERAPGRSFEHPERPLGEEILEHTPDSGIAREESVYGRAPEVGEPPHNGVADRAKAIGVLRKADEFMSTDNPAPTSARATRRALELAAGRLGLTIDEYDRIVRDDPELVALERKVIEDAVRRHQR